MVVVKPENVKMVQIIIVCQSLAVSKSVLPEAVGTLYIVGSLDFILFTIQTKTTRTIKKTVTATKTPMYSDIVELSFEDGTTK